MDQQTPFGLQGLAELGARGGIDMRPTLLRVLTDLYVHRLSHTAEEERHYTELALRLLDGVDAATRTAVAKRFARYLSPPLRVLQRLSRDLPEVTAELRTHPLLQPRSAQAPAPAVASRPVAETGGRPQRRPPPRPAPPLDGPAAAELNEMFFAAEPAERRLILRNLDVVAPSPAAGARIAGEEPIIQRLETAALRGMREEFAQQIARALQIPRTLGQRIAQDRYGEPVVIAGKALAMPREVLCRILMFVNPTVGHSVERVHALAALHDEITSSAAQAMLAIWQALQRPQRATPAYRPIGSDDDARVRPRLQTSARHRPPAPADTHKRRNAS
jgi:hypothetical protein